MRWFKRKCKSMVISYNAIDRGTGIVYHRLEVLDFDPEKFRDSGILELVMFKLRNREQFDAKVEILAVSII